jgi:hypothetical protein
MVISVVNPTETPQECDLHLSGVQASGPTKVFQLTAPARETPPPGGPGWGRFSGPPATPAESSLPEAPSRITLPPASLTVYEFDAK